MDTDKLIKGCKKGDRRSQNQVFEMYAPVMLSICRRYFKNVETAEDIMVQAFFKVFDKIDSYKGQGSFEGWIKRIVINECLMELRKNNVLNLAVSIEDASFDAKVEWQDNLTYEELISLLDELPTGYRTVFNMYVIEGFKHREIAEKLGVSINTSKSQLILARKKLMRLLKKKYRIEVA